MCESCNLLFLFKESCTQLEEKDKDKSHGNIVMHELLITEKYYWKYILG